MADPHDTASIAALSDGIFGVALTLLVLDVHVLGPSTAPLTAQLLTLGPRLLSFGLTFAVVGVYWSAYHRLLAHIVGFDQSQVWRVFVFLALIVFTPFPTGLIGEEHFIRLTDARVAWITYAGTLALVGLTLAWIWHTARTHELTDPGLAPPVAEYLLVRTLVAPMVFVLSIGVAFLSVKLAFLTPLLIIPAHTLVYKRYAQGAIDAS